MDAAKSVTANYSQNDYKVTTNVTGNGTVTGAGTSYHWGDTVNVTATPAAGWSLGTVTGDCSSVPCTLTINGDKTVNVVFTQNSYVLTTAASPVAGGTVTPATGPVLSNTVVTVTQTPNAGYTFTGWSGDCTGTTTCSVTMDAAKSVTANYTQNAYKVTTNVTGNGTVTGAGTSYHWGDTVSVTATPAAGWSLGTVTGDCTSVPCTLTINGDKTVNVVFTQNSYVLDRKSTRLNSSH